MLSHQLQLSKGAINRKVVKNNVRPDLPKTSFTIHEGTVRADFEKLYESGRPLLQTDQKYVVFTGVTELNDRSCVHVELRNPGDQTIIFNIRTPASPNFFVKPHLGMLEGKKKTTLFFTFRAHCHRVPSDYCWIYSIYHIVIPEKKKLWILEDEFSSTNLRLVWNQRGRGDIQNILHLSCKFEEIERKGLTKECKRHKIQKNIYLNDTGEVDNVEPTAAEEGSSEKKDETKKEKKEDSTDSEIPKTAEG